MSSLNKLPKLCAALGPCRSCWPSCGVNTIPTKDQAVKARWADVQAAYQRRAT
jgi:LemA protein